MQSTVAPRTSLPLFDRGLDELDQFILRRPVIGFDFDGTLAPLMPSPDTVRVRKETAALLARVCQLFPCVVISGRRRSDVARRLRGLPVREIIGNHGIEAGAQAPIPAPQLRCWSADLEEQLETLDGVAIEDKQYSITVHYRACADRRRARARILQIAESFVGARVVEGILCVNLVPAEYPNKGGALLKAVEGLNAAAAIFVGDDVTDEDAFVAAPDRVLGIRVGHGISTARYHLRSQTELDLLLTRLIALGEGRIQ